MRRNTILVSKMALSAALVLTAGGAFADQASDIAEVKAADVAFHAALSAMDAKAMAAVWADKPYVTNIGPSSKTIAVGYAEAVTEWMAKVVPGRFSELKAQMTSVSSLEVNGNIAWVVGVENASGKDKAGEPLAFDLLVTNIYEKIGDKWLMVSHHAQRPPK